jgi:hypothetical protein
MACTSEWHRYTDAERAYFSAIQDFVVLAYEPIMLAALDGRAHDGPRSFRAAIGVLPLLPQRWIEENLDVLARLALEGGPEWFALNAEFDRVPTEKLNDVLQIITNEITLSESAGPDEYRALLSLLKERAKDDLIARVIARAAESPNPEIRELSDG